MLQILWQFEILGLRIFRLIYRKSLLAQFSTQYSGQFILESLLENGIFLSEKHPTYLKIEPKNTHGVPRWQILDYVIP